MHKTPVAARVGAIFFLLWGAAHIAGAVLQLVTFRDGGGGALTSMIATALPPTSSYDVPPPAAAFMAMGAWNIGWIGAFVCVVAIGMNWRNSQCGYLMNMGIVGATDLGLTIALLVPGYMSWSDGAIGLITFGLAAVASTIGVLQGRARKGESRA